MGHIHVIFKKEDIRPDQMSGKVAIVYDVLFATSTITAALADGALSIIPVYDQNQAREKARTFADPFILAGEERGKTVEGFHHPLRTSLQPVVKDRHLILSTTNGTVALQRSSQANHLYASSLLNNPAMARHLLHNHRNDTILLVCSGSSGKYTIEDYYGVGSIIHHLQQLGEWELSDAAKTALLFYKGSGPSGFQLLRTSTIGRMLVEHGLDPKEIQFVAQEGLLDVIPKYDPNNGQIKEEHKHATC